MMLLGVTFSTIYSFLERYQRQLLNSTEEELHLANFFCELTLTEFKMNKWLPSRIASSALYLACKMLRPKEHIWSKAMREVSKLSVADVKESARDICLLINKSQSCSILKPITTKYSAPKYLNVTRVLARFASDSYEENSPVNSAPKNRQ